MFLMARRRRPRRRVRRRRPRRRVRRRARRVEGRLIPSCGVTCHRVLHRGGCVVMPDYLHHLLSRSTSGSLNLWGQSKCLSIIFSTHDNIFLLYTWQFFDSFAGTGSFTERAVNRTTLSLSY